MKKAVQEKKETPIPLEDRIYIKPVAAETKTKGGIIVPDVAKEKPSRGTVMAVGAGKDGVPMIVKVGDDVIYGKFAGTEIEFEDKVYSKMPGGAYLLMRQSDVLSIM